MDRNTYILNADLNGEHGQYVFPEKAYNSNILKLIFNFTSHDFVDLVKLKIFFDRASYVFEFDDIPHDFTLTKKTPIKSATKDIIQVKLYYSNLNTYEFLMPLFFNTPSILDDFDGGSLVHAQFLDTNENDDLFFTFKNTKKQFFNFRSGSNVITYNSNKPIDDLQVPIIAAVSAINTIESVTANLVTEFSEFIEVNT